MTRNQNSDGLLLKNRRIGEIHKSATILTPRLGIIDAIAHGAYKGKSKLGGVTEVFSRSQFSLYHNPARNSYKITDVEPISFYENLRGNLEKYYTASLFAEVILRTYAGGGDFGDVYPICCDAMSLLDRCVTGRISAVLSLFLFEYVDHLGYLPDLDSCGRCGRKLDGTGYWYVGDSGSILCSGCGRDGLPALSPGARRWLAYVRRKTVEDKLKVELDRASAAELKRAMLEIIQHVIGGPLHTIRSAGGIV